MKRKKMITSLTVALFSVVLVGAFFVPGVEREALELESASERNVVSSSCQLNSKGNWVAMQNLSNEISLEDLENAYYYQMIEDMSIVGQAEAENSTKARSCDEPCVQINSCQSCDC